MAHKDEKLAVRSTSPSRVLLTGALLGAGAGLVAALLLHRRAKRHERDNTLTMGEAVKLGLLVFGLLKAISVLGDDD